MRRTSGSRCIAVIAALLALTGSACSSSHRATERTLIDGSGQQADSTTSVAFEAAPAEPGRTSTTAITGTLAIVASWLPDGYTESTSAMATFFSFGSEPSKTEDPPKVFTIWAKNADGPPGTLQAIVLFADRLDREGLNIARFGPKDSVATTGIRPGISVLVGATSAALREYRWEESGAAIKVVVFGDLDHAGVERFIRSLAVT